MNHVHRIGRAVALGQNVLYTSHFQNGTHGAAGDDTGTFRSRLHVHLGGAMSGLDRVLQSGAVQIHLDHVATRSFARLLDGSRNFTGLATAETDATLAITHHGQRGEGEDTAALYGFGNAVNLDQLLDVAFVALLVVICHNLELQSAFTSSIGQRLDATVILEARTIESHLGDASGFRTLGYQLTHFLGRFDVAGSTVAQGFVQSRGAGQDLGAVGRNDLGVDVLGRAVHAKAYGFQLAHFQACLASATQTSFFLYAHLLCPTSS